MRARGRGVFVRGVGAGRLMLDAQAGWDDGAVDVSLDDERLEQHRQQRNEHKHRPPPFDGGRMALAAASAPPEHGDVIVYRAPPGKPGLAQRATNRAE